MSLLGLFLTRLIYGQDPILSEWVLYNYGRIGGGYDEGEKRRGEEEEGSKRTWTGKVTTDVHVHFKKYKNQYICTSIWIDCS